MCLLHALFTLPGCSVHRVSTALRPKGRNESCRRFTDTGQHSNSTTRCEDGQGGYCRKNARKLFKSMHLQEPAPPPSANNMLCRCSTGGQQKRKRSVVQDRYARLVRPTSPSTGSGLREACKVINRYTHRPRNFPTLQVFPSRLTAAYLRTVGTGSSH